MNLIEVKNLKKYFPVKKGIFFSRTTGYLHAVDDVSFYIKEGETLGLVGESGCGKTTLGRLVLRLLDATDGTVAFKGKNIFKLNKYDMRKERKNMQIIFQDPYASLNPRMTVGNIVAEPLDIHRVAFGRERRNQIHELLNTVGLSNSYVNRYPHEFSGGQRQRIAIARALALKPEFIIADEPVSALDVSIQAQIINLLMELQKNMSLTYLFISHNLSVIRHISSRIGVMYLGKLVEMANADELYKNPLHPYTQTLLSAIPVPDLNRKKVDRIIPSGDIPSPINPPNNCRFNTRCPVAQEICRNEMPEMKYVDNEHYVACHMVKGG